MFWSPTSDGPSSAMTTCLNPAQRNRSSRTSATVDHTRLKNKRGAPDVRTLGHIL